MKGGRINLTLTQLQMLRDLAERGDRTYDKWGWGSSNTNPTGCALEARGLAKCEYDYSKSCAGFPWSRWVITPMGLDWLKLEAAEPRK